MPRLTLRKCLLYSAVAACFSLLLVGVQQESLYSDPELERHKSQSAQSVPRVRSATAPLQDNNITASSSTARSTQATSSPAARRAWFFSGGSQRPAKGLTPAIWPEQDDGDRIVNQLNYRSAAPTGRVKSILLYGNWGPLVEVGSREFERSHCPVNACELTTSHSRLPDVDAVVFKDYFNDQSVRRNVQQVWIMYLLECPLHTAGFRGVSSFNWTATYRHDSDLVAPYEKWVYYDDHVHFRPQTVNYAASKTKKVAWFVSNCGASNQRLKYAKELAKHIEVDIYGACGTKRCPRSMAGHCFEKLNVDYKFYLAFENSNCRDYITEKFFVNGLKHNILPIVMGAHPDDYRRAAPEHSYLHVDDFESARHLADFLKQLDRDDDLYNTYFHWKGTGEFVNTFFFCRLCAALHAPAHTKVIPDMNHWWRGPGTCTTGRWSQTPTSRPPSTAAAARDTLQLPASPPQL